MSEKSPIAYNPRDRIKHHLKRKSSCRSLVPSFEASQTSQSLKLLPEISTESCPAPSTSSNPFKVGSPVKKRHKPQQHVNFADSVFDSEENARDAFSDDVFNHSKNIKENQKTPVKSPRRSPRKKATAKHTTFERYKSFDPQTLLKECYATDFSHLLDKKERNVIDEVFAETKNIPQDYRIATKLRITSKMPFSWMNSRKNTGIVTVRLAATDRYEGLKYFNDREVVRAHPGDVGILEAATLYYQFPVIPGMSLYPRITTEIGTVQRIPMSPLATTTMFHQWVESYEQLFHSYKKGDRKSFYVACAIFNVLFTKTEEMEDFGGAGEDSQSCFRMSNGQKLIAIVSHTTSSVREHLRSQGVEYEVIGKAQKRLSIDTSLTGFDDTNDSPILEIQPEEKEERKGESEEDENESPTKANQQWLKEIGVSPRNVIRNLPARKLSTRTADKNEGILSLLVQDSSVQSLYNTLMSSDIVHEKTGPYTKIPPTLIADSSFLYGQLLSLNKTSHIVQQKGKPTEYILELDRGPILSHTATLLSEYLRGSKLCTSSEAAVIRASDRHSSNGMNSWTESADDWQQVHVYPETVRWTKK